MTRTPKRTPRATKSKRCCCFMNDTHMYVLRRYACSPKSNTQDATTGLLAPIIPSEARQRLCCAKGSFLALIALSPFT